MTPETPTVEMHPQRWGDPDRATDLPDSARGLVELAFGSRECPAATGARPPAPALDDARLDGLRAIVGAEHVLLDDATRALRTRGKSTPDLLRARAGDLDDAPDAVVRPDGHGEVAAVLAWAAEHRVAVVPFGGGTCVTGGLAARRDGFAGLVSLDLVRMKRLLAVDEVSMTATLQPGLRGPEAEALLGARGLTLGHYPQSWEHASIGGFAATRSSGQSSAGYGRFAAPYLRDSLLDHGVLVETLETATFWSDRERLYDDVRTALQDTLGEGTLVLCHVSHVYETGCSLYFTVAARQGDDPVAQWHAAKAAASDAIVAAGATITHHHAVGTDHRPWLAHEIGEVGVRVLRAVKAELDPAGVLNPGVLIP